LFILLHKNRALHSDEQRASGEWWCWQLRCGAEARGRRKALSQLHGHRHLGMMEGGHYESVSKWF
jgi:hypothetical protein